MLQFKLAKGEGPTVSSVQDTARYHLGSTSRVSGGDSAKGKEEKENICPLSAVV